MKKVLRQVGLRRQITVVLPVAMVQAKKNLGMALQETIVLSGQWQTTRYYWGYLDRDRFILNGPRAHKHFCFLTQGVFSPGEGPDQTRLDLEIVLGQVSETHLLRMVGGFFVALGVMFNLFGLVLLPLFLAFFYGMTQLHFEYYMGEIRQLLCDRIMG
ncbi:MAG: hypothetical protein AAFY20_15855 [Cyanobacteria bacterium J06639_14]